MEWRKSTYSGANGGDSVEVADTAGVILVHDTKDRAGAVLAFAPQAWREFAANLKRESRDLAP